MCKLNQQILSYIQDNIVTYHIYKAVSASMSVEQFEAGFRYVAAVALPRAAYEAYYYRHHRISEIIMKFTINHDTLRVVFGTYDRFEEELELILRTGNSPCTP